MHDMHARTLLFALGLAVAAGCGDTGQGRVSYPLVATGEAAAPFDDLGWTVTLSAARMAFGPVYFCATRSADADLCATAQAEFADVVVVDLLQSSPQALGQVDGLSGSVASVAFNLGWNWFNTQAAAQPFATTASALDGHSAHFEGSATNGTSTVHFTADVDIAPHAQGARAVQGPPVSANVESSDVTLTAHFSPSTWWQQVDFDDLSKQADAGGNVVVQPGSRASNALITAIIALAPPSFTWSGSGNVGAASGGGAP
jgi:hypothetical protein